MKFTEEEKTKIKQVIESEYKKNKKLYHDKEEPLIGIRSGNLFFYDGDLKLTNKIT